MSENTKANNGKGFDYAQILANIMPHVDAIKADIVTENEFAELVKWPTDKGGTRAGNHVSAGTIRGFRAHTEETPEGLHISKPLFGIDVARVPQEIADLFGGGIFYFRALAPLVERNWHEALKNGERSHVSKLSASELKSFINNMHFDAGLVKELKSLKTDAMRKRLLEITGIADHGFDESVRAINAAAEDAARRANQAALEAVLARQNGVTTEAKGQGAHASK